MSTLHRLVRAFESSFSELGTHAQPEEIEKLAFLIHRCMGGLARQFHTIDHVFGFFDGADAKTMLAAMFHDVVYFQVDKGFPAGVEELIAPYVKRDGGGWKIEPDIEKSKTLRPQESAKLAAEFRTIREIFGFVEGQNLTTQTGMNEFLSAMVMWLNLRTILPEAVVVELVACIEATIAFRPADADEKSALERLENKLIKAGVEPTLADSYVRRATRFANTDVSDFKLEDTGRFLNNTWKLLPEINPSLRVQGYYSVTEYRKAIQGMEGFFGFLNPELIYHRYRDEPGEKEYAHMLEMAGANLAYAREYLQAKLLAVGVLEAAVASTGGDVPLSYVMGDIPTDGVATDRMDDMLPDVKGSLSEQGTVYTLLESGRMSESSFDLKNSPLALFLYRQLTKAEFDERMSATRDLFTGTLDGKTYLRGWKNEIRKPLIESLSKMVPTRREKLLALL